MEKCTRAAICNGYTVVLKYQAPKKCTDSFDGEKIWVLSSFLDICLCVPQPSIVSSFLSLLLFMVIQNHGNVAHLDKFQGISSLAIWLVTD